jgi:hypothetical protein
LISNRAARAIGIGLGMAAALFVANLAAYRASPRPIDLTGDRAFTLDPATRGLLKRLDQPATFTLFLGNNPMARSLRGQARLLLELYRAERPALVRLEEISAESEPARFQAFARRMPEAAVAAPTGGVALEVGARRTLVPLEDLIGMADPGDPTSTVATFRGEDALTAALARVLAGTALRVAFTTGHGERSSESMDDPEAVGRLRVRLKAFGAESLVWDPRTEDPPPGLDVALVVRPRAMWDEAARTRFRAWLDAGGRAVLILDGATPTGLEPDLAAIGIELGPGPIVDPRLNLRGRPDAPIAPIAARDAHPIARSLAAQGVLAPSSSPLNLTPGTDPGTRIEPIVRTGPDARVEGRDDAIGPFVIAAALSRIGVAGTATPSLVVIAVAEFADNATAAASPGNLDLIVNAVGWLRGRPSLMGLAPRNTIAGRLGLDPNLKARLVLIPTISAVSVLLAAGVGLTLARRS